MENNKATTRFFAGLTCFALFVSALNSVVQESWTPLFAFGCVLFGLLALAVIWAIVFAPVLSVMGRLSGMRQNKNNDGKSEQGAPGYRR